MNTRVTFVIVGVLAALAACDAYKIGVGRADCTGPPVEVVFVSITIIKFCFLKVKKSIYKILRFLFVW